MVRTEANLLVFMFASVQAIHFLLMCAPHKFCPHANSYHHQYRYNTVCSVSSLSKAFFFIYWTRRYLSGIKNAEAAKAFTPVGAGFLWAAIRVCHFNEQQ